MCYNVHRGEIMRNSPTDNYDSIALIGNSPSDIKFMHYLFESQGVKSVYDFNFELPDLDKDDILKRIAYYFGSRGPVLIDNNGLRQLFEKYGINETISIPKLSAQDIINQINFCMQSDVVYVCNSCGEISNYISFILGYLMSKKQEIFFWNDIDESEWLMSSITKNNNHGFKETIVFPLEIVRVLAFPYILNEDNDDKKIGVPRNTTFSIDTEEAIETLPKTVVFLGSLRKQLDSIKNQAYEYQKNGYTVLAPKISAVKKDTNGFIVFEDDESDEPILIEKDFLEKCLKSEEIVICNNDGYIGNTVMMEMGYLLGKGKKIKLIEEPIEKWVMATIEHLEKQMEKVAKRQI